MQQDIALRPRVRRPRRSRRPDRRTSARRIDDRRPRPADARRSAQIDGKTYAIPTGVNAFALVANPKLFAGSRGRGARTTRPGRGTTACSSAAQVSEGLAGGHVSALQDMGYVDDQPGDLRPPARASRSTTPTASSGSATPDAGRTGGRSSTALARHRRRAAARPSPSRSQAGGLDGSLTATGKGAMGTWWTNQLPAPDRGLAAGAGAAALPGRERRTPGCSSSRRCSSQRRPAAASTRRRRRSSSTSCSTTPEAAEIMLSDRGLPVNTPNCARRSRRSSSRPTRSPRSSSRRSGPALAAPPPLPPKGAGEVQRRSSSSSTSRCCSTSSRVDQAVRAVPQPGRGGDQRLGGEAAAAPLGGHAATSCPLSGYDVTTCRPRPQTDEGAANGASAGRRRRYAVVGTGHRAEMYVAALLGSHADAGRAGGAVRPEPARIAYYQRPAPSRPGPRRRGRCPRTRPTGSPSCSPSSGRTSSS